MDELLAEFIAETRETLEAVAGELVAWEHDPADQARLDTIFRFVHTVKGSCGFLDLPRLEKLSHAAEDVLSDVRSGKRIADSALVSGVLAIIDRIAELTNALDTGEAIPDGDEALIGALCDRRGGEGTKARNTVSTSRTAVRSIRISLDLLETMMNGVSDLVLARNELSRKLQDMGADPAIEASFDRLSSCVADMRETVTRMRMQRIEKLFSMIPRLVRDLAADLSKQVNLQIDGGDVELDREMIEMIRDPLTHIVRNALDHGLEHPEDRLRLGKPAAGMLRIDARQAGNQILIDIADDGRGIDTDRLVEKAIAAGVITPAEADRLSPEARLNLIFEPGISTAKGVTALSGRGVGMDVVRANVERIGGAIDIESIRGKGLMLSIRVPLTLTIIPALLVCAGGEFYAIPRSAIQEIVRETSAAVSIEHLGGSRIVRLRDQRIPVVLLEEALGIEIITQSIEPRSLVILNPAGGASYALSVARLHDHQELVIRPPSPAIMAIGIYAGMTLPDTGRPMLLLDPAGIADKVGIAAISNGADAIIAANDDADVAGIPTLLFRDLDGAERAVRLGVVERIGEVQSNQIGFSGGRLRASIDGRIIPLIGFDALTERETVAILRMNDGATEVAYAIDEVIDIVSLPPEIVPAKTEGIIAGVALIEGRQVEVLDAHWLFADSNDGVRAGADRPLCVLASADDAWMREVLKPLVEAAGYRTLLAGEEAGETADIIIATEDASTVEISADAQILRLRNDIVAREDKPDSIYRYDRAGLMSALQRGRGLRGG